MNAVALTSDFWTRVEAEMAVKANATIRGCIDDREAAIQRGVAKLIESPRKANLIVHYATSMSLGALSIEVARRLRNVSTKGKPTALQQLRAAICNAQFREVWADMREQRNMEG
jgi:hypothetical protein